MKQDNPKVRTSKFFNSNLTTTISIALVLFLIGLIAVLSLLTKEMSSYVKENLSFSVVLTDSASNEDVKHLAQVLQSAPYARNIEYISKEKALVELSEELGENPQDFLGYNPLSASFEVKIKAGFANAENMEKIEKSIAKYAAVREIIYKKTMIDMVNNNMHTVSIFLAGIAALFLIISIGLINNTIRLQIYSKRFTINTMKLVGATPWFIRKPFLGKGLVNGIIAAVIASVFLIALVYYVQTYHLVATDINLWNLELMGITLGVVFVVGIVLSFFCSLFAVGKYLRFTTNDLYYI
ncbi:MAG: permease-like cell division protein FtsX [Prevotellaceae bacterium]|jgi:cell division transport system permease protein|nr:permease-like cell division protein FtsX [Prevotellaceae bacterium]